MHGSLKNSHLTLTRVTGEYIDTSDDYADAKSANLPVQFIPTNAAESVIMTALKPGAYTAIVRGVNQSVGIGIVEVFEVD